MLNTSAVLLPRSYTEAGIHTKRLADESLIFTDLSPLRLKSNFSVSQALLSSNGNYYLYVGVTQNAAVGLS